MQLATPQKKKLCSFAHHSALTHCGNPPKLGLLGLKRSPLGSFLHIGAVEHRPVTIWEKAHWKTQRCRKNPQLNFGWVVFFSRIFCWYFKWSNVFSWFKTIGVVSLPPPAVLVYRKYTISRTTLGEVWINIVTFPRKWLWSGMFIQVTRSLGSWFQGVFFRYSQW